MNPSIITNIIDKHLQLWVNQELNKLPRHIEPEMADIQGVDEEGWAIWHPIKSTVTNEEIRVVEKELNCILPGSYKIYLQHKHFYELYINEARFSGQEIRGLKSYLTKKAFEEYPPELLIGKGYLPFADWYDWGVLCFDTNNSTGDNEYPVILWDHDDWTRYQPFSDSFQELLVKLDTLSDDEFRYNTLTTN